MVNLLCAVTTETIIGIIAIVVIVVSVGIIAATAFRNYKLRKKYKIDETEDANTIDDGDIQEIVNQSEPELANETGIAVVESGDQVSEEEAEEDFEEEVVQEIDLNSQNETEVEDLNNVRVQDNSMAELVDKMGGNN